MSRKVSDKSTWFYIALGCVAVSIISLFLPIFRYGSGKNVMTFNIIDLISGNEDFVNNILRGYHGPFEVDITGGMVTVMAIIAVASLICAVVGLVTLRAQKPNTKNFIFTIIGLVGILIPSVIAMIVVFGFGKYYSKSISLGIAPIIAPIAIIICIGVVIRRKSRLTKEMEQLQKEVEEKGLIRKAGDL